MQKVIIAGGTSGIGLSTAKLLVSRSYQVIILGRNPEKLKNALAEINQSNSSDIKAEGENADAKNANELKKAFLETGKFDHLVITISGGKGNGMFQDLNLKTLRDGFEEKFFTQLQTAQEALPYLNVRGSITFITAASAQSALPGTSGLGAINGALETMIPTLAKELKPRRINAVSPGVINTTWWDFLPAEQKRETFEQYAKTIPAGKIGEPEDVAAMIVALMENSYITGQTIVVDGGISLGQ